MVTITKAIGVFFIWILVLHLLCAAEKVSSSRIFFGNTFCSFRDSLVAQMVKRLPAMRETQFDPWIRKIPWRRKWQPTPVFLPGKTHGQRSLAGYSPWGHKELDMTKRLPFFSFPLFVLLRQTSEIHKISINLYVVITPLPEENHLIFLRKNEIFF